MRLVHGKYVPCCAPISISTSISISYPYPYPHIHPHPHPHPYPCLHLPIDVCVRIFNSVVQTGRWRNPPLPHTWREGADGPGHTNHIPSLKNDFRVEKNDFCTLNQLRIRNLEVAEEGVDEQALLRAVVALLLLLGRELRPVPASSGARAQARAQARSGTGTGTGIHTHTHTHRHTQEHTGTHAHTQTAKTDRWRDRHTPCAHTHTITNTYPRIRKRTHARMRARTPARPHARTPARRPRRPPHARMRAHTYTD